MDVSGVQKQYSGFISPSCVDEEEKLIMQRLLAYGVRPTGNKTVDREKLHQIELKEAKSLNYITNKFLTVSRSAQENIQEKKKQLRQENNPELKQEYKEKFTGANTLGEQKFLAINMNNKKYRYTKDSSSVISNDKKI